MSDGMLNVPLDDETGPVLDCILATAMLALGSIHTVRKRRRTLV